MLLPFLHWPATRRHGRLKYLALFAPFILLSGYIAYGFVGIQIDSPLAALRHFAALPNCAAARAVGLAPARRGQPGYWPTHGEVWRPAYFVRVHADGGVIDRIADYYACPWILEMVFGDAERGGAFPSPQGGKVRNAHFAS